jgi:beta-glucanase (GH16 family)
VTPTDITYFIDGRVVATAPQVKGGGAPMFFLVNLALGGGWPVDLRAVQERAVLYVDYVRVYV